MREDLIIQKESLNSKKQRSSELLVCILIQREQPIIDSLEEERFVGKLGLEQTLMDIDISERLLELPKLYLHHLHDGLELR